MRTLAIIVGMVLAAIVGLTIVAVTLAVCPRNVVGE